MKQYINLILVLLFIYPVCCIAQTANTAGKDSISTAAKDFISRTDSVRIDSLATGKGQEKYKANSTRALLYSAIFPGLGQIYNRKYWKLPLVYGSFLGCIYAITWNGTQYNGYRKAYLDFIDDDPNTKSWEDYRYGSYKSIEPEDWTPDMNSKFSSALKSAKDYYRRYRDMSYIITIGVYAIWMIDAYIDAQLFDFDISPDLNVRIEPVLFDRTPYSDRSFGMQLSLVF